MVRIDSNKLIIEIACSNSQNPLELLTDYQTGIVGALHAYAYADMSGIPDNEHQLSFQRTIQQLTFLLSEMMFTHDQSREVGKAFIGEKEALKSSNYLVDVSNY